MYTALMLFLPTALFVLDGPTDEKTIRAEVIVQAPIEAVWEAWTTEAGAASFFAPACRIELQVDGAYEMYFNPQAKSGERGGEGMRILALDPPRMLAFTWNAPPHLANVREQRTFVQVKLEPVSSSETKVQLVHTGFGDGGQWEESYTYFNHAWPEIVLPFLQHRFAEGPIDWANPPLGSE